MTQIISAEVGNITTIVKSSKELLTFESRIEEAQEQHLLDSNREVFEIEGKKYIAEMGSFENNLYKYEKKNFKNILHYAIAKVADSGNVKLITSIPANQYNSFKDEMKNVIMNNNKISVKINEVTKNITIEEVAILPEGYSIFKTTPKEFLIEGAKTVIIDIGGGTTELILFDELGRFVNGDSINKGLLNLFNLIQTDIQTKTKKLLSIEDVRKLIDKKLNIVGLNNYTYDLIISEFANNLMNLIKGKIAEIDQYNVLVVGGGADILKDTIKDHISHALFNTDVASLCKSNYKVAEAKWQRK